MSHNLMTELEKSLLEKVGPAHSEEWNRAVNACLVDLRHQREQTGRQWTRIQGVERLAHLTNDIGSHAARQNMMAVPGFDAYSIGYDPHKDRLSIVTHEHGLTALCFAEREYAMAMLERYEKPLLGAFRMIYSAASGLPCAPESPYDL